MTGEAASPRASGAPVRTCRRCGHQTGGCLRCGKDDDLLGGWIWDDEYCHTDTASTPSCYMLESWNRESRPIEGARR